MKFFTFGNKNKYSNNVANMQINHFEGTPGGKIQSEEGNIYVIHHLIGNGGFADVYLVTCGNKKKYALKMLRMEQIIPQERQEVRQRFEREYNCSKTSSPFLVKSYDKGILKGNPFFVMDYCPLGNLGQRLGKIKDATTLKKIALPILKGLQELHRQGIIHRDLKPENILFNESGDPLLTDFGISGFMKSRITIRNWMGHVKKIFGTIAYMPPEQLNAKEAFLSLSPATDMFAFGVTMHELITGVLPFGEYLPIEEEKYLNRLNNGQWIEFEKHLSSIPSAWQVIITGCLQPNPLHRFKSAFDVLALLQEENSYEGPGDMMAMSHKEHMLQVLQGDEHGKIYSITQLARKKNSSLLTIGWMDEKKTGINDIEIKEKFTQYISRFHATLEFNTVHNQWILRDGQCILKGKNLEWIPSTNGVYINFRRTNEEGSLLCPGDKIIFGDTVLQFKNI